MATGEQALTLPIRHRQGSNSLAAQEKILCSSIPSYPGEVNPGVLSELQALVGRFVSFLLVQQGKQRSSYSNTSILKSTIIRYSTGSYVPTRESIGDVEPLVSKVPQFYADNPKVYMFDGMFDQLSQCSQRWPHCYRPWNNNPGESSGGCSKAFEPGKLPQSRTIEKWGREA